MNFNTYVASSPYYLQANELAERMMRMVKEHSTDPIKLCSATEQHLFPGLLSC